MLSEKNLYNDIEFAECHFGQRVADHLKANGVQILSLYGNGYLVSDNGHKMVLTYTDIIELSIDMRKD